jgi:Ni,Fe-hydrogenase I small subunit
VLLLCTRAEEQDATALARSLVQRLSLAVVSIDGSLKQDHGAYTVHSAQADSNVLQSLVQGADCVLAFGYVARLEFVRNSSKPVAVIGTDLTSADLPRFDPSDVEDVLAWCLRRGLA